MDSTADVLAALTCVALSCLYYTIESMNVLLSAATCETVLTHQ